MLIYDNKKQFIGIDEDNLKSLGYSNLASMQAEAADFADLFVKIPGHIHNFKHVHWIDFMLCSTDKSSSKVIIHANGKNFSSVLDIKTIYLTSNPTKPAYNISLNNLRFLSAGETQEISGELQTRVAPVSTPYVAEIEKEEDEEVQTQEISESVEVLDATPSVVENDIMDIDIDEDIIPQSKVEEDPYELEDEFNLDVFEPSSEELEKIGDAEPEDRQITREDLAENLHEHIILDDDTEDINIESEEVISSAPAEVQSDTEEEAESDYIFDIQETADALEMDIATIQDFINDFIMQAKEFKPKLYEAVDNDDMIELKSLSHQLKGVAANLRIHDAQEILIQINKASDFTTSIADLNKFYKIIAKLAGEDIEDKKPETKPIIENNIEDEPLEIADVEDEPLEIADIEDEPLEIADVEDEPLEIADIEDEPLEIADVEDEPLEIADIDNFDILDEEQDELIDTKEKENILNEIEDIKPTQLYDKMVVANEIGLDEESFNELFDDYAKASKELISEIKEAIESNKSQIWQHAAVKLKGMCDNMRVDAFKTDIEALITTQNSDDANNIVNNIEETLFQILELKD
ncbi:hypothetical protein [Sulfurimonas lithotrophica]|uniref:hypothetical protein n=1 Tax=Sulfurimonas lithotrophica TaxID=2590022 RepID=UPI001F515C72|nr:hypothetical protein [Sulfurimonas lithotrophica]